ncbi:MAG: hypothetical protein KDA65_08575 [Planctomycetaceae bacterium]|nr:hypothetical protein [Planctomycetaceae bacterium]
MKRVVYITGTAILILSCGAFLWLLNGGRVTYVGSRTYQVDNSEREITDSIAIEYGTLALSEIYADACPWKAIPHGRTQEENEFFSQNVHTANEGAIRFENTCDQVRRTVVLELKDGNIACDIFIPK